MKKSACVGLLPVGLTDVLPPFAQSESFGVGKILSVFYQYDYQRVTPSLLEFEETLFSNKEEELSRQTFRLTDPLSGKVMGVRADQTSQISRIAQTRLQKEPRPLRLAYAGQVVRMFGSQKNPARQLLQVGAELIGVDCAKADAEIILLALESLETLGIKELSLDLNLPTFFKALCKAYEIEEELQKQLQMFLNQKDFSSAVDVLEKTNQRVKQAKALFVALFEAYGDCTRVLEKISALDLPEEARAERARLIEVIKIIQQEKPNCQITVDILENTGFEYHQGVGFSIYSKEKGLELGRGGRYLCRAAKDFVEPATGMTLYMAEILSLLELPPPLKRVYVPSEVPFSQTKALNSQGFVVVWGVKNEKKQEALQLKCDYIYNSGQIEPLCL